MFRAIISPILRSSRLCLQLVVKCTEEVACWWPSSVQYTTSCKHRLVLLRMGKIIVRNMLSWLKLPINCYCCIYLVIYCYCKLRRFCTNCIKLTHNRVVVAVFIFIYLPTKSISIICWYWVGGGVVGAGRGFEIKLQAQLDHFHSIYCLSWHDYWQPSSGMILGAMN